MKLVSREYKVMLDQEPFVDRTAARKKLRKALATLVDGKEDVTMTGDFDEEDQRAIVFLDTPEKDFRRGGFVFRRRLQSRKAEYTLKCRSEDRYFAAGADLRTVKGFRPEEKLEEDIAPQFLVRFSHSNTVRPPKKSPLRLGEPPRILGESTAFFPVLDTVRHDRKALPADTPLQVVNGITAFERVYTGTRFHFKSGIAGRDSKASVALILWTDGENGPPMVAEFSFRLEDPNERFSRILSGAARSLFCGIQTLDWARPDGTTKTGFIYQDKDGD